MTRSERVGSGIQRRRQSSAHRSGWKGGHRWQVKDETGVERRAEGMGWCRRVAGGNSGEEASQRRLLLSKEGSNLKDIPQLAGNSPLVLTQLESPQTVLLPCTQDVDRITVLQCDLEHIEC